MMYKHLYKPYYEEKPFGDKYIVSWDRWEPDTSMALRIFAHYKDYPGDEGENVFEYEPCFNNGYPSFGKFKTFDEAHERLMQRYYKECGKYPA